MNPFRDDLLEGKRILVTGGGTGLGREMALKFASLGAQVAIIGRREQPLRETAEEIAALGRARPFWRSCDIRDADAVDRLVEALFAQAPLTGLVNNAAGNFAARTKDLSPRGFNAIADIVFRGSFYVTQAVGKRWLAGGWRGGSIVSILATWVLNGTPFMTPSAMSKAGVLAMTRSLAIEWGPYGVRLNAIAPGAFPTPGAVERTMGGDAGRAGIAIERNPSGRIGEMEELTNLAAFLVSDASPYLTGEMICLDGGAHLASGANFSFMASYGDAEWAAIRQAARAADGKAAQEAST